MKLLFVFLLVFNIFSTQAQQVIGMCDDENRTFTYTVSSYPNGTYYWYINGILQNSEASSIVINWDTYALGFQNIEVWFESNEGCSTEPQSLTVETRECENSYLYAPNAFTPDGDAFNNEWKPSGWNWKDVHYMIFNRWGEIIFESYNGNVGWDGTYAGSPCQDGIYAYLLKWNDVNNRSYYTYGHITLIR